MLNWMLFSCLKFAVLSVLIKIFLVGITLIHLTPLKPIISQMIPFFKKIIYITLAFQFRIIFSCTLCHNAVAHVPESL